MKHLRSLLSLSILAAFAAWLVWYVRSHPDDFRPILQVSPWSIVALVSIFLLIMMCNGFFTRDVMIAFGIRLPFREWLALAYMGSFLNTILPFRGGAGFRATYLKGAYRFSFSNFIATFSAMYLLLFFVNGMLGVVAMGLLAADGEGFSLVLGAFMIAIAVLSLAAMVFRVPLPAFERTPGRQVARIVNGWEILRGNRPVLLRLIAATTGFVAFTFVQYNAAFGAVGVELSWAGAMFYVAARNIAMMISITPGSLGIAEALAIYMGQTLHYSAAEALLVQGLIRAVSLGVLAIAFPFASHTLGVSFADARRVMRASDSTSEPQPNDGTRS